MTSLFIILFMFIHNSSSKNGRKTTASKLVKHLFSAGCVGEFLQFWLSALFPRTNFDTKIVNFVLKLVLRELPKGNTVNFSHFSALCLLQKLFFRVFFSYGQLLFYNSNFLILNKSRKAN